MHLNLSFWNVAQVTNMINSF
ncbi:hypothetical protein BU114_09020 [Staphylococcus shinii]|uniref:BspA family leucine-rich repeat surface protein n=1 Tax=Staphylococcus shinii TaxID=2912228 RepID=A0A418IJM4_9STAP|nr:hypothetical protein [Staphylococcus shinii]PKI10097.1 hypothetical protein CW747_05655 [Staphylococcus shinii]PKI14692.1 hypothetical protein CW743_05470 [Staphylococcus shinii]PTI00918.1 hypothetical protein BU114_09020 [Staphylococcus shinii]PTI65263.1 hypothetical protein BU110_09335 [Staphylococcus shinii]